MLVELHFDDREYLRLKSSSNRVHLLPWTVEGNDRCDNFNPEVSIAMAALLPDGWMFKERLQSSGSIFDSENDIRAGFAMQDEGRVDQPNETYEQHMARIHAVLNKMADTIAHGEEVEFATGKRDYTANQLRRLSTTMLSELVADGFDLSTSDETGQTALRLAAIPPFSRDQLESSSPSEPT